ncbi:glycosyltransferase family 2 protein [Bdellovibrio sp. HCB209]|uniref:glycosyltransferase family 2 protein n=1 Tax=Bdellovibrio sp. HCB209 TaxID=3394354 RepID=UPI0039B59FFF
MRPQLTYIILSYNHSAYLDDCLNSVELDFPESFEIIIMDDGSTDNSRDILDRWAEKHSKHPIRKHYQENKGIATTLNTAYAMAEGEFVRPISTDDAVLPGSTAKMVELLKKDPTKLMVFGDCETIDSQGVVLARSNIERLGSTAQAYSDDIKKAIISEWAICGTCLIYRNGFLNIMGGYNQELAIEDWDMYLRMAAGDRSVFYSEGTGQYRIHDTNTSRTKLVAKRISNLTSQMKAGEANLPKFSGIYRLLLRAELRLLLAKISYLQKKYVRTSYEVLVYFLLTGVGRLLFVFSRK